MGLIYYELEVGEINSSHSLSEMLQFSLSEMLQFSSSMRSYN